MLLIGVTPGGYWKNLSTADFLISFSVKLQFIPRAIFILFLATLVEIIGSIIISWKEKGVRTLWLLAAACFVLLLAFT